MNERLAARGHHPRHGGLHPVIVVAAGVQGHHRLAGEEAGGDHRRHDPQGEDQGSFVSISSNGLGMSEFTPVQLLCFY